MPCSHHSHLPEATPIAYEQELCDPISANIFPSYIAAIRAMLWTLPDPRVGAQWLTNGETVALSANSHTGDSHSRSTAIRTIFFPEVGIGNNRPRIVEASQAALVSESNGHGRPVNRIQESVCR